MGRLGPPVSALGTGDPSTADPLDPLAARDLAERLRTELAGWQGTPDLDLGAVLGQANVGLLHRDLRGRVISVNDRFCDLVGRTAEQLFGLHMSAFIHPDDLDRSQTRFQGHLARAEPFCTEARYVRPDGTFRLCEIHIAFVGAPGKVDSLVAVALDITAQRMAEQKLRESEEHYRNTVELAAQINWTADPTGRIIEVGPRWQQVTGLTLAETLGNGWVHALKERDVRPTLTAWKVALKTGTPIDIEYRVRMTSGGYRWFRSRAAPRFDDHGQILRWYGTLEDIDDRKQAEHALRESEERFRLAAHAAGLGIWDLDATRDHREWSDEFKDMLGLPRDTAATVETALSLVVPEDRHKLQALVEAVKAGDSAQRFEVLLRIRRADTGAERWMQTSGWRIEAPGKRLERVLVTVRDVTEERTAEHRIRWAANHDSLTELPNRGYFTEQLEAAIARAAAQDARLTLVLLDVDHLKETNDTIGHDAGDRLLQAFAQRLSEGLDGACVGRLGGDEFAAFLEVRYEAEAVERVSEALHSSRRSVLYEGIRLDCHATAGAATFPLDGKTAAELLKAADIALYHGKSRDRGRLSCFRSEMRNDMQRRSSMLAVARAVLRDDALLPFYQPKVALADERIVGFEALLRWRDATHGIQGPAALSAAFDDLELASLIAERMLDRICGDLRDWLDKGLDVGRVAVNLSPAEFRRADLFDRFMDRLRSAGIPPSMLELEVTETVFLGRSAEAVAGQLCAFHREGVRIALDDFGTGYASLTHLQAFPVDVIKIDRSFVADLSESSGNGAIVDAVIGLASRLGMEVVAEGIETRDQAAYLAAHGCVYGQGYLFGKAVSSSDVENMLRTRRSRQG
ncbi:sensor domain-containing protein [Sphingomonas jatrophae]|uniref:PAS domain S-box-containing protein/diguanylate cyclase (GGDEF) domain-containing protein n=1 Tax=Sphingomonas jatrophae TaxID=1166337 RepID=A0A1I6MD64_9SPHN|nr:GGDEF domain-containing phosphodiesterase [Sphingomonas jatrophae]SFS13644.1 PAS domain S-box-containing protein/diguanylate cyclase (GGDEF) domain-containing protein [Sphingomonas jatrophae]